MKQRIKKEQLWHNYSLTILYCLLQGAYWSVSAAATDYAAMPLLRERGYSSIEIGVINSAKFISLIFFQYFIGKFADKYRGRVSLKSIVTVLNIITVAAALALLTLPDSFLLAIIVFIAFGASVNCALPMIEALSIRYMGAGMKMTYTYSRAVGSFTYCVFAYLLGIWTERYGMDLALKFIIGGVAVFELINIAMPKEPGYRAGERGRAKPHSVSWIIKNCSKYRWFLIECFFIYLGFDMNLAFIYDRIIDIGGSSSDYGLVYAVIGLSEIPVAIFYSKIRQIRGVTTERLIACFGVFTTIRAVLTTIALDVTTMALAQLAELLGMSIYYAASVYFVMDTVPLEDSAKAMSLINLAGVGLANAIGYFLSGIIRSEMGVIPLMSISCLVSGLGIVSGLVLLRQEK